MRKLLTLVLCWLLAFEAFGATTFKAKTSVSVAGGYVTSLNKIDGSFEDGSTQWSASVGTIVPTASTEFQGNYKGVWSGTGAGTLDLQWTATASNTYEASTQVNVRGKNDVYVCAYVGPTETGCKLIPALNKIQKVSVVADSVISSAFHLRLKHTGSDAFSIDVDDGKIEPWTAQAVNLVEQESVSFTGYSSGTNPVVFLTKDTQRSNEKNLIAVSTVGSAGTVSRYTVLKPIQATVVAGIDPAASGSFYAYIVHYDSSGTALKSEKIAFANSAAGGFSVSLTTKANTGDYFLVSTNSTPTNNTATNFSITATAISDNVVQSWQDGTEWTSYTPTFSAGFGTVTNAAGKWKRSGSDLEVIVSCVVGTVAGSLATVTLPSGLSIDPSRLSINNNSGSAGNIVGVYNLSTSAANTGGNVVLAPSTSGSLFYFGTYEGGTTSHITPANGNLVGSNSATFTFTAKVPILGWSSTPTLLALPTSKENRFDGEFNSSGLIQQPNNTVLGNAVVSDTSLYTIPLQSGVFTTSPNVTASLNYNQPIGSGVGTIGVVSISTTQIVVRTGYVDSNGFNVRYALPFTLYVSKKSPDYTAPGVLISNLNPDGFNRTLGTTGLIDNFSFSYGTTNATTVCSASPCSYLDQIGNYVTSVTRGSAGAYVASLSKTFSKLKCGLNGWISGVGGTFTDGGVQCSNCSSIQFNSRNTSNASADSYGTVMCQGQ